MPKRDLPVLQSKRVELRLLRPADLPLTLAWRNRDEVRKWFFHSDPIAPEAHRAWFESYCTRDDDFVFIIEEREAANRPVGQVSLYHVDWEAGCAEFGRLLIGEFAARGKGLALEATALLVGQALTTLGLRQINLSLRADNAAALSVYRACGFQETTRDENIVTMSVNIENLARS